MSTAFRPISAQMPLSAAADLMVRRGECRNFYLAYARIRAERTKAARKSREQAAKIAAYRSPYAEN